MSDIHALSGAYAVDALDDDERAQFERHLAGCPACRGEVESLREAAALLAETTTVTPSAELRNRVLAQIGTVRPLPPEVARPDPTVTELASRRRRRVTTLLAAAAAVVAIGAGGVVWQQARDDGCDQFCRISAADDVQRFTMPVGDGGTATIVVSRHDNKAYIETRGMPAAPPDHQYVLWLQHGDTMTAAGVMPEGPANTVLLDGDVTTANAAAVSVEEAGPAPTKPGDNVVVLFSFDSKEL